VNKNKLFLGGGGDSVSSKEIDDLYGKVLGAKARVLYVPVAMKGLATYEDCLSWFSAAYEKFDFEIEMMTNLDGCDSDYLNNFDSVYIGGGNTFGLLQAIKESGFMGLLDDYIKSGKIVYGGSAGAIILGKSIKTAGLGNCPDLNEVGLSDFYGLNMIGDFAVHCHYEKADYSKVKQFSEENNIEVLALSEQSGLYVNGDKINFIGEVVVFSLGD